MDANVGHGAVTTGGGDGEMIREISRPLMEGKTWVKLLGVLLIINGVLTAWALFPIFYIWIGVLLFQSANSAELAYASGQKAAIITSLEKLRTSFTIAGVITLISIIISVVFFFGFLALGGIATLMEEYESGGW
jgi:hypothetical protein